VKRIYVVGDVHDRFVAALVNAANASA